MCTFLYSTRLKPIIGVSEGLAFGLTLFHCPIFNDWQSDCDLTNSVDSTFQCQYIPMPIHTDTVNSAPQEFTMGTWTKQAIINHPKYAHLFLGMCYFKGRPMHITMKQNRTPVQKPPRRVPIAMKDKFKQELDSMESQGIISKFDGCDISPEWLNSFVIVKKPSGALHICLDPKDLNKEIIRSVCNADN